MPIVAMPDGARVSSPTRRALKKKARLRGCEAQLMLDRLTVPSDSIVWRPQHSPRTERELGDVTIIRGT